MAQGPSFAKGMGADSLSEYDSSFHGDIAVDRETGEVVGGSHGDSSGPVQPRGDARLIVEAEDTRLPIPTHALQDIVDGSGERVDVHATMEAGPTGAAESHEHSEFSNALLECSLNAAGVFLAEPILKAVQLAEALAPGLPGPKQEVLLAPRPTPKAQTTIEGPTRTSSQPQAPAISPLANMARGAHNHSRQQ
jgi:hypothetical protein